MKSVTQIKSLGDVRTSISTHGHSAPRLNGVTYLELYLLDKEKQRLETELSILAKRQGRIQERLGEISKVVEKMVGKAQEKDDPGFCLPTSHVGQTSPGNDSDPVKLKTMTVEY